MGGLDGVGEYCFSWVGGGGNELDVGLEEGAAPALRVEEVSRYLAMKGKAIDVRRGGL